MSFSNPSIKSGKTTIVEVNEIFVPYTNIYTDKAYAEDIRSECIGRISFVDEEVDFESDFLSEIQRLGLDNKKIFMNNPASPNFIAYKKLRTCMMAVLGKIRIIRLVKSVI